MVVTYCDLLDRTVSELRNRKDLTAGVGARVSHTKGAILVCASYFNMVVLGIKLFQFVFEFQLETFKVKSQLYVIFILDLACFPFVLGFLLGRVEREIDRGFDSRDFLGYHVCFGLGLAHVGLQSHEVSECLAEVEA